MQLGMMLMLHFPMQNTLSLFKSIMDNYNYPIGADTKDAPWNQVDNPEKEIEVTVSVTLSKTIKINVSDYEIIDSGKNEDGEYVEDLDFSNCDLKEAVENQYILPQDKCSDWNIDDFEVVLS